MKKTLRRVFALVSILGLGFGAAACTSSPVGPEYDFGSQNYDFGSQNYDFGSQNYDFGSQN